MPRDKTASHEKIVEAAMREFQERGFEQASMKRIADEVGMTSAGLYRHFDSKEAMFAAMVQPAIDAYEEWTKMHISTSYDLLEDGNTDLMWDFTNFRSDASMILQVMYQQPEAFRLLLFCSAGTKYAGFLRDIIEDATDHMMDFLQVCSDRGIPARMIGRDEMHMLITAYVTAMVEPIEHSYSVEDAEKYLRTIMEFFTPGWRLITGL